MKNRYTIGANGFTIDVDTAAETYLSNVKITQSQLSNNADKLSRVINQLNWIIETMPTDLFEGYVGDSIKEAGDLLNDVTGMLGVAFDRGFGKVRA